MLNMLYNFSTHWWLAVAQIRYDVTACLPLGDRITKSDGKFDICNGNAVYSKIVSFSDNMRSNVLNNIHGFW